MHTNVLFPWHWGSFHQFTMITPISDSLGSCTRCLNGKKCKESTTCIQKAIEQYIKKKSQDYTIDACKRCMKGKKKCKKSLTCIQYVIMKKKMK